MWFFDDSGDLAEQQESEGRYEPDQLSIKADGTLNLMSREGEMTCTYYLKDHRIVLPEWGDEVVWNYTMEGSEMVIEELIYDGGVLFSQSFTRYQRH